MRRSGELLAVALVLGGTPVATWAQADRTVPDSAAAEAAKRTLRSDLRNFATAQESYFADHSTYARSLREMAAFFRPTATVTLVLLTATDTGHSEIAIDERVPGLVCAMYVGGVPPPLGRGQEGEVVCRGP